MLLKLNYLRVGKGRLKIKIKENYFLIRDLYDVFGLREVFIDKVYAWLFENLYRGTTYIDFGGFIGDSVTFASSFKNIKQIIVVEPFPDNLSLIKENIRLNEIKRIKIIEGAVAKTRGERSFYIHHNKGQSGFSKQNNNVYKIQVPTITLSEIVRLVKTPHVILKCDIEGAEYEIFMNTPIKMLKKFDKIIFEYHISLNKLNKLLDRFKKVGFNVTFKKNFVEFNLGNAYCSKEIIDSNFAKYN